MGPHTMGRYRTNAKTHDLSCATPAPWTWQSQVFFVDKYRFFELKDSQDVEFDVLYSVFAGIRIC